MNKDESKAERRPSFAGAFHTRRCRIFCFKKRNVTSMSGSVGKEAFEVACSIRTIVTSIAGNLAWSSGSSCNAARIDT
jgi:hypothetical protein